MKTVGELLKSARHSKHLSLQDLARQTKIRVDYLQAIEQNRFADLPSATFVKGFIKNYARAVNLPPHHPLALFRRDFDQNQQGKVIPRGLEKPIKASSPIWNPRTTTIVLATFLFLVILGYSLKQIITYSQAPFINLTSPTEGQTTSSLVEVIGDTSPDATLTVNKKPTTIDINGHFTTHLDLQPGPHTLVIEAQSRDGKTRTLTRTITVNLQSP